jgi:hypothetical protein
VTALPEIPVLDVGVDWPFEILRGQLDRINALLDEGSGRIPKPAIKIADAISPVRPPRGSSATGSATC